MNPESEQVVESEQAHAEALVANDKVIEAEQTGGSIARAEAVEEAKADASGTREQREADREKARIEAEARYAEAKTTVLNGLDMLDRVFKAVNAVEKTSNVVPVEKPAPIVIENPTAEMLAKQAQAETNSAIAGAAAESVAAASAARAEQPLAPLAPGAITEVPAFPVTSEAGAAVSAPTEAPPV